MPYPEAPGSRLAYDIDGTQVLFVSRENGSLEVRDMPQVISSYLNVERNTTPAVIAPTTGSTSTSRFLVYVVLCFPTPMRVRGFHLNASVFASIAGGARAHRDPLVYAESSSTSTNGIDGTWNSLGPALSSTGLDPGGSYAGVERIPTIDAYTLVENSGANEFDWARLRPTNDDYRRNREDGGFGWVRVGGAASRNVTSVRFSFMSYDALSTTTLRDMYYMRHIIFHSLHLYADADVNSTEKRLAFWSPDSDTPLPSAYLDWGDVPQGTSEDRVVRVRNMSLQQTAAGIFVAAYPTSTVPQSPSTPVDSQLLFSVDGGITWDSTVSISSLSPNAVSEEIIVRRVTPSNFALSNWAARVVATVGEWV